MKNNSTSETKSVGVVKGRFEADLQRGYSVNGHGYECPNEHGTYSLSDGESSVSDEEVQTKGLMNIDVLNHSVRNGE